MGSEADVVILQTTLFATWLRDLKDRRAKARIADRVKRLAAGQPGDTKPVGGGVQELRLHFGPGYRVYYMWQGTLLVMLLNGGDKDSQQRDIARSQKLAKEADDGVEIESL